MFSRLNGFYLKKNQIAIGKRKSRERIGPALLTTAPVGCKTSRNFYSRGRERLDWSRRRRIPRYCCSIFWIKLFKLDFKFSFWKHKELTEEQNELINQALMPSPPDQVLTEGFNTRLSRKDTQTLRGLNWLNDEIINFYMSLICERNTAKSDSLPKTYAFSTFFYPKLLKDGFASLKRWTRKCDIFSYDLILVPVHLGLHWTLAVIDIGCKEVRYYDSMMGNNHDCLKALRYVRVYLKNNQNYE